MSLNTIKVPTLEQLREVAAELGFTFDDADLAAHRDALLPGFEAYNRLDRMPDAAPSISVLTYQAPCRFSSGEGRRPGSRG